MATVVDLNGIKAQIATVLSAANTTTASPIDISNGLSTRVQSVLKIHPEMIEVQASLYPFVTCYVNSKTMDQDSIAVNQLSAKKRAKVELHIVGAVWNSNFSIEEEDPADEDINKLMENVEYALRTSPELANEVQWQITDSVEYYISRLDSKNALRAGIIKMVATVFY